MEPQLKSRSLFLNFNRQIWTQSEEPFQVVCHSLEWNRQILASFKESANIEFREPLHTKFPVLNNVHKLVEEQRGSEFTLRNDDINEGNRRHAPKLWQVLKPHAL